MKQITSRKIRIWFSGKELTNSVEITINNHQSVHTFSNLEHTPIIVSFDITIENQYELLICCLTGKVGVGQIDINYSLVPNKLLFDNFNKEMTCLLNSKFDLSEIPMEIIAAIRNQELLTSSGSDEYASTDSLLISPTVNNISVSHTGFNILNITDSFKCKLYVTKPVEEILVATNTKLSSELVPTMAYKYDQSFFDKLDPAFYSYVITKVSNESIDRNDSQHTYQWTYHDKIRIQKMLIDNVDLIKDKKIIDLGCNTGLFSFVCATLGATTVLGTNIRPELNNICNMAAASIGIDKKLSVIYHDVYDLQTIPKLLDGIDTILFSGLIYHINHHYTLLTELTKSNATSIIIDTHIHDIDFYLSNSADIRWVEESQDCDLNGFDSDAINADVTFVGLPTAQWISHALQNLGWTIKSSTVVQFCSFRSRLSARGIVTATRDNK